MKMPKRKSCAAYILLLCCVVLAALLFLTKPEENILRIGTTGDYQPLSWYDSATESYVGFDIDVAKAMSKALHVKIVFVRTTWKSLSQDLMDHKFDVAMSGISITTERAKQFIFSEPVLVDKKVVLIRCSDKSTLNSFNNINQKNVRLMENIGGTNEMCARQYFKKAYLILVNDNKSIFADLIAHRADAMITDEIEANYYSRKNPMVLCVIDLPPQYTYTSQKAYMLRKEETSLQEKINHFIETIKRDSTLTELQKKWLK
jgi:cyclohexadienyl dehydratase